MKTIIFYLSIILFASSCSSTKLVNEWKSPETVNFEANKVLVVGITTNVELRRTFEKKVTDAFEKKGVIAVKSVDFFEQSFTHGEKSEEELDQIENELLEAGFDAVLFSKVTGQESRVSVVQSYRKFARNYETFRDYYYNNQHVYHKEQKEQYKVYNTITSLYCICPGKVKELLWQGEIDIVDAERVNKNINDYVRILIDALENKQLLIVNI